MQQCQPVNESIYGRQTDTDRKRLQWQERGEEMSFPIPYTSKSLTSSKQSPMTRTVIPVLFFSPFLLSLSSLHRVTMKSAPKYASLAAIINDMPSSSSHWQRVSAETRGFIARMNMPFILVFFSIPHCRFSSDVAEKKTKRKRPKQEYAGRGRRRRRRRRFLRWGITFSNFLPFSFAWISVSLFLFPYHLTAKLHGVKAYHIIIYCRSSEAFEKLWEEDWFCRSCRWSS